MFKKNCEKRTIICKLNLQNKHKKKFNLKTA